MAVILNEMVGWDDVNIGYANDDTAFPATIGGNTGFHPRSWLL
jgi:hypothetical protein